MAMPRGKTRRGRHTSSSLVIGGEVRGVIFMGNVEEGESYSAALKMKQCDSFYPALYFM